jgi:hypothetical protein
MGRYNEDSIVQEAEQILGDGTTVLAAGYFGLQDLIAAQLAGGTAGALTGSAADVGGLGGAVGAGLGGAAAVKAYAESQGVTVQLILAVTDDQLLVLNRDTDGRLPSRVATFDRSACDVEISKMGLSRFVAITDTTSGDKLTLHGAVSPLSAQSKGDKAVMELLAA